MKVNLRQMPEPVADDPDGALVIWWTMSFRGGGHPYTFSAMYSRGRWFKTGTHANQGSTWKELIEWILKVGSDVSTVWVAGCWVPIEEWGDDDGQG